MKKIKIILLFLVICISCFAQNRTRTNTSTNKRVIWEYKVVIKQDGYFWDYPKYLHAFPNQTAMLKEMGNEGWELVNVYIEIPSIYLGEGTKLSSTTHFVFKRPKSGK
jgi:carbonic anhydrase